MQDEFHIAESVDGFVVVDGQRRQVRLELGPDGIRSEAGQSIPWNRARLRRDEADEALIVIGRGIVLGSTSPEFMRSIEGVAGNDLDREIARLEGQATGVRGLPFLGCLLFFGLIVWGLVQVPGCYRSSVDSTVKSLPKDFDVTLGEAALESAPGGKEIEDPIVLEAIRAMVERLEEHFEGTDLVATAVEWQIRVIDDDETINAYALPGGFITVYSGLIEAAETPDMVAGVVAHEMAHVLQRHGLKRVANKAGLFIGLGLVFGDAGGLLSLGPGLLDLLLDSGYSRDLEAEADDFGVKAMAGAGLDPKSLAEFFDILKKEYGDLPPLLQWMGTHPDHTSRIAAIESIVAEMQDPPPRTPLDVDWEAVLEALGK